MPISRNQSLITRAVKNNGYPLVAEWIPATIPKDGLTLNHTYEQYLLESPIPQLKPFLIRQET